jgi:hypothetical protein
VRWPSRMLVIWVAMKKSSTILTISNPGVEALRSRTRRSDHPLQIGINRASA